MRNIRYFTPYRHHFRSGLLCTVLCLVPCISSYAQSFQGLGALSEISSFLGTAGRYVINIVFAVCGLVLLVSLIPSLIKALEGDPHAKGQLVNHALAGVAVIIIIAVVNAVFLK